MPENEIDDVIKRCLQNDQSACTQLYQQFADGVYRLCYGLVMNKHDVEDVVQDSFVYAFKNLHRFDCNRASFKTWLYTIAVSRCRNTYRRKRLTQVDLSQLFHLQLCAPRSETPEARLASKNAQDELVKALANISPQLREAVVLRYGHGLTFREIADVMCCPAKTAESRIRLAHQQLRGLLEVSGRGLLEELLSF